MALIQSNVHSMAVFDETRITQDKILPGAIKPGHLVVGQNPSGTLYQSDGTNFAPVLLGEDGQYLGITNGVLSFQELPDTEWVSLNATLAYSSADDPTYIVSTSTDLTGTLGLGMKIRFINNSTTFYGFITAITSNSITLYGGTDYDVANSAITSPAYSSTRSPYGFPLNPAKWTVEVSDTTNRTQGSPVAGTWYNLNSTSITVPIGVWRVYYNIPLYGNWAGSTATLSCTLSTASNTESDPDFSGFVGGAASAVNGSLQTKEKVLTLTTKTTYYANAKCDVATTNITFLNAFAKLFIRAVCVYL